MAMMTMRRVRKDSIARKRKAAALAPDFVAETRAGTQKQEET